MRKLFTLGLALVLVSVIATPALADGWKRIDAPAHFTDRNGIERSPSCSGGPVPVPGALPDQANTDYAFFVRPGDPRRLAIFFDGGGACWDKNTCLGTALLGSSVYTQEIDETVEALNASPGLADASNPGNPIGEYTQVYIPYCTGDLHTGSNDQGYTLETDLGPLDWTIRHRGADNVAFVLDWLAKHYGKLGYPPSKVFLSGASAGGYGVTYHYPAIARMLPWYTRTRVLVDAANGVITDDFYNRTLTPDGVWGVWENLAPELQSAFSSGADQITVELFKSLAWNYPGARFGQYTTAFDEVQIGFFNLARNTDRPDLWEDPNELALSAFEWTIRARTYMNLVAFQTWNYRYYIAAGGDHTVVGSDKFYTEDSAAGVPLVDWVDDMINRRWLWWGSDWRNVSCTPDCLELD